MSNYTNTRKHQRFNLNHQVIITKPYTDTLTIEAKSIDISLGGLGVKLQSLNQLNAGDQVHIQCLGTQSAKGLSLMAVVARQDQSIVGLEFTDNTPDKVQALKEFIITQTDSTN